MVLENPIVLAALICFLVGLVLSGFVRLIRCPAIASTVLPIIFLASYVFTYGQVPTFPPVGSTNKIYMSGRLSSGVTSCSLHRLCGA